MCVLCECTGVYWCAREVCACGCVLAASLSLSLKLCEEHALNSTLFIFFFRFNTSYTKKCTLLKKNYIFFINTIIVYIYAYIYIYDLNTHRTLALN